MEWKDKIDSFKKIDVRGIQGNFFQGLKKQAMQLPAGNGLEIVQSSFPHQCCRSRTYASGDKGTCEGIHPRSGQRCIG